VNHAFESKEAFIDSFREATVPLSPAEIERFNSGAFDSGVETDEEDIDRVLYDEEHGMNSKLFEAAVDTFERYDDHSLSFDDDFDSIVSRIDPETAAERG